MIDSFSGEYRFLSNFYPCIVKYNNFIFSSVENAYQASKCRTESEQHQFLNISAGMAKRLGKVVTLRSDWDTVKVSIMSDLVHQKFYNKELQKKLIATNYEEIVEGNNWDDTFCGRCNNIGENNLGKILMKEREQLQKNVIV